MARSTRVLGAVLALVGAFVMVGPFVSVSRIGGHMLGELPKVAGADVVDERFGWRAMFDDEFVVARRTYSGVSETVVVDAFRHGPYERRGADGFSRECCGDYDAVLITISTSDSGAVAAALTPADADVQSTWPVVALLGLIVLISGLWLGAIGAGRRHRNDRAVRDSEQVAAQR